MILNVGYGFIWREDYEFPWLSSVFYAFLFFKTARPTSPLFALRWALIGFASGTISMGSG
ncbi:hypothetical protein ADN00_03720 [Ornatilinea apprima]|uniref:Uncharacterized protein n=1 Tax=Ornatilinea apprima TaxID=1134406 RepID=A0A0N8GNT7_9CHLR|nr:hypothetical protein ADN00_03720 [Ornatilinea apprima]